MAYVKGLWKVYTIYAHNVLSGTGGLQNCFILSQKCRLSKPVLFETML